MMNLTDSLPAGRQFRDAVADTAPSTSHARVMPPLRDASRIREPAGSITLRSSLADHIAHRFVPCTGCPGDGLCHTGAEVAGDVHLCRVQRFQVCHDGVPELFEPPGPTIRSIEHR